MERRSDTELLRDSYRHPALFAEIFDRHHKKFLSIARRSLRSREEAEDAVQATLVKIYKYGQKFLKTGGDFGKWSRTILRNAIIDQSHKESRETVQLTEEMESTLGSGDEYATFESTNYFQSIVSRMQDTGAHILNLRFTLGKSFKEIGKILNITSTAARVRVYRAKKEFLEIRNQYGKY